MPSPNGSLIHTFSGREIDPRDIRPEDILLEDIAHALALCNRFAGHTIKPISVAQHSVYVARLCDEDKTAALQGLLHDAAEAYIGDVTKWLKATPAFAEYREIEDKLQRKIFAKFNLPEEILPKVEEADRLMVRYEGYMGFGPDFKIDHPNYPPLTQEEIQRIGPWGFWKWHESKRLFFDHYRMFNS